MVQYSYNNIAIIVTNVVALEFSSAKFGNVAFLTLPFHLFSFFLPRVRT